MTRRRWLLLGMLVAAAVVAAGLWLNQPPRSAINAENAAKIEIGMTLAEVEAVLGGPARDETTGPVNDVIFGGELMLPGGPSAEWVSDEYRVWVWLDSEGRVDLYSDSPVQRLPETPLEKLRRWLRL